jgi:hypothetical protein
MEAYHPGPALVPCPYHKLWFSSLILDHLRAYIIHVLTIPSHPDHQSHGDNENDRETHLLRPPYQGKQLLYSNHIFQRLTVLIRNLPL